MRFSRITKNTLTSMGLEWLGLGRGGSKRIKVLNVHGRGCVSDTGWR